MTTWIVPPLADLNPGIQPSEFKVLVAMAELPKKTAGGILLPDLKHEHEAQGADTARVVAASPIAFTFHDGWPAHPERPQVGQVVMVGRFPGEEVQGRDGRMYRLINDRDIKAVMEEVA